MERIPAALVLSNGSTFEGWSFGHAGSAAGEVVFSTSMVGYPESLTDPSFEGQILCVCYPLVGNYGIPSTALGPDGLALHGESEHIHVRGLVIADYSEHYSHWDAVKSLGTWLQEEGVAALSGIDTRALTRMLREEGTMQGRILIDGTPAPEAACGHPVARVSCREVVRYGKGAKRVVLVDCGVKHNIIRCLVSRGVEVVRVPWDYDFNAVDCDGIFLSNGPGDPKDCAATIGHLKAALQGDRPVFGVCLGSQLTALAAGGDTFKLPYGHRSHNQPVRLAGTDRCFITSQNHGYAVDPTSLPEGWEPYFVNLNDGTSEGIRHAEKPFFATQFHPEAAGGPVDTEFLFDRFVKML